MSRPRKKGLTYFPKDVDFYQDEKVIDLLMKYGPLGLVTFDVLLTMVYREGYYIEMSPSKAALLVVRTVGDSWYKRNGMTPINFAAEIIQYCAEIGLFNASLVKQNVITSVGIQRRYAAVTVRNKVDKSKYWLLESEPAQEALESASKNGGSAEKKGVSATETPIKSAKMPQRKGNKRRVNKTKLKKMTAPPKRRRLTFRCRVITEKKSEIIKREYGRILPGMPDAVITPKLLRHLAKADKGIGIYRKLFETAAKSTFLTTPKTGWRCDLEWLCDPANMEKVLAGKYSDYGKQTREPESVPLASSFDIDDFFAASMARSAKTNEAMEDDEVLPWLKGD